MFKERELLLPVHLDYFQIVAGKKINSLFGFLILFIVGYFKNILVFYIKERKLFVFGPHTVKVSIFIIKEPRVKKPVLDEIIYTLATFLENYSLF